MARVQAEVQRLETAKSSPAPDPPAGLVVDPLDQLRDEIADAVVEARQSNQVRTRIPGFLRPLFRNHGRCNRLLLRAVELQEKHIGILQTIMARQAEELGTLQEVTLPSLRAEIASQKETLARLLDQLNLARQETARPTPADGDQTPPSQPRP